MKPVKRRNGSLANVRFGSFAAELFSLRADLCPLLVQ